MKILIGKQIKELDQATIERGGITSLELMEYASESVAQAIAQRVGQESPLLFFVGKGNNGGDGLAVARMLANTGYECGVVMVYPTNQLTEEARINFERLPQEVEVVDNVEDIDAEVVVIDAMLGTGVEGETREPIKTHIEKINRSGAMVIAIDLPSGMRSEFGNEGQAVVRADLTLTLQFPKLALLLPEAGDRVGEIEILDIELDGEFMQESKTEFYYVTEELINSFKKRRQTHSHKGDYGHALMVCGSEKMMGASILATNAALRSGCGLVTAHTPEKFASALYASAPSAMQSHDPKSYFSVVPQHPERYKSCGVGCGIGENEETKRALHALLRQFERPMVLDADALNILADHPEMVNDIPTGSILTPHVGELRRLVGEWSGEDEKLAKASELAKRIEGVVVIKGAHTASCLSDGRVFFNSSGNAGMAKGGSGDVLTGFVTGLLARGYSPNQAALLGVFLHGRAGDKSKEYYGAEAMNSADIIDFLGE